MTAVSQLAAKVFRGNTIEAYHNASIVVLDNEGSITHYLGDPEMMIMTRSSIKMFQVMALFTSGAADHFGFSDKQLAIMCGSHTGSDEHREVVLSNLKLAGNSVDDLQCGCHWPLGMEDSKTFPTHGEEKDVLRHNCSGKHSGFLALAKYINDDIENHLDPNSKTQKMIKQIVAEYCEYPENKIDVTIDGCSAPNFSIPLKNLALGIMKLAAGKGSDSVSPDIVNRIKKIVQSNPEMVSGEGRFDLDLAKSFPDNIINKFGAETIQIIGFSDPSIGIAVKVHDGNSRVLGAVCVEIFKQLGLVDNIEDFPYLLQYKEPVVKNVQNKVTGKIIADFKLQKV